MSSCLCRIGRQPRLITSLPRTLTSRGAAWSQSRAAVLQSQPAGIASFLSPAEFAAVLFQAAEVEEAFSHPTIMARVSPGPGQRSVRLQEPGREPMDLTGMMTEAT